MNVVLPFTIFAAWLAIIVAPAAALALEDTRNNVSEGKRHGVSLLPGFPLMPLIAWGGAVGVDKVIQPWGSWIFVSVHGVLLVIVVVIIVRAAQRQSKMAN